MKPHELMKLVNMSIGAKHVADIMHKSLPQVYRYATAPNNCPDTPWTPGPFARVDSLMEALVNAGDLQTARAVAGRWAHLAGCTLVENTPVRPDRGTIAEECLDDHGVLVRFHQVANDMTSDYQTVCELAEAAKREIDETREKRLLLGLGSRHGQARRGWAWRVEDWQGTEPGQAWPVMAWPG